MEDLGFAFILLLIIIWIASWSILSAIVAGFIHTSPNMGALLGVTLGPLGLLATLSLPRNELKKSAEVATPLLTDHFPPTIENVDPFA